jgi:hypothetical protein
MVELGTLKKEKGLLANTTSHALFQNGKEHCMTGEGIDNEVLKN